MGNKEENLKSTSHSWNIEKIKLMAQEVYKQEQEQKREEEKTPHINYANCTK
jgi:hypothetical protein